MSRSPPAPFRSPPLLGEHADEILAELDHLPRQTAALPDQGTLIVKPKTRAKTDMNETIRARQDHPAEVMKQIIGNALLPEVRKAN